MTRRELLQSSAAFLAIAPHDKQIISEPNCLSEESARGFSMFSIPKNAIVLAAASSTRESDALRLRKDCECGGQLIWELSPYAGTNQRALLKHFFNAEIGASTDSTELYVRYKLPKPVLTRTFIAHLPVLSGEAIAHYGSTPIAARHVVGRGSLTLLGAMLGPHLLSGDPQAADLFKQLLLEAAEYTPLAQVPQESGRRSVPAFPPMSRS